MRTPSFSFLLSLSLLAAAALPAAALAHGSLENGRMLQVRLAGPNGKTPAPWTESYYTWNQNSHNFPDYANPGFQYSATVPDGTLANAGINDGVQTPLNFSGLNNPGAGWQKTAVTAGDSVPLHWLATALHDPSHFEVYLTKAGVNADTKVLAWGDLEYLGRWAVGNATRPAATSTRPHPLGGTIPSYDWMVPVPADRSGHAALLVIWQRDDPAGEAFFSVLDLQVAPVVAAVAVPRLAVSRPAGGLLTVDLHQALAGRTYTLEATDTLPNGTWTPLATGVADTSGHWQTTDPGASGYARRFYRAVTPP